MASPPAPQLLLLLLLFLLHPITLCRARPHHGFGHSGGTRTRRDHPDPAATAAHHHPVPPPPPATRWRHQVFLNFRGADVRHTFCDYLYYALVQKGIKAFRDDRDLPRGENFTEAIPSAIEDSKLSIVVLSRGYASSEYCLDELVKIMQTMKEKGHKPFPIFYNLSPEEVADHQSSGCYKDDFKRHKRRYSYERVESWSSALTGIAQITGWVITGDRSEAKMVGEIAEDMLLKVQQMDTSVEPTTEDGAAGNPPTYPENEVGNGSSCDSDNEAMFICTTETAIWAVTLRTTIAYLVFSVVFKKILHKFLAPVVRQFP